MARNRTDVYRVVAARLISATGSEGAFFVGIWGKAAYELHADASALALVMFVLAAASILGNIVAGVLVDRYGPRRVLAVSEIVFVPATLAMAAVHSIPLLTVLVGFWSFTAAPVQTSAASFAPFLSDEKDLARTNAWIESSNSAALLAGPALAALVVSVASISAVFVLDAITSVVGAVIIWGIRTNVSGRGASDRHPLAELREGVRTVYATRPLRYYVLAGTVAWLSFGSFAALEPLFFRDVVHRGVTTIGWVNTLFGAGLLLGAAVLARIPRRAVSARSLALFLVASGFCAWLYVGSTNIVRIGVGALVWGLVIGILEPLMRTLIHRDSPHAVVGRVIGTAEVHRRSGELLPLAVAPALAARFGVQATLIAGGLFGAALALASFGEAAAIDRIPHTVEPPQPLAAESPLPPG